MRIVRKNITFSCMNFLYSSWIFQFFKLERDLSFITTEFLTLKKIGANSSPSFSSPLLRLTEAMRLIFPLFGIGSLEDGTWAELSSFFWGTFDLKVPCSNLDAGGVAPRLARPRRLVPRSIPVSVAIQVECSGRSE